MLWWCLHTHTSKCLVHCQFWESSWIYLLKSFPGTVNCNSPPLSFCTQRHSNPLANTYKKETCFYIMSQETLNKEKYATILPIKIMCLHFLSAVWGNVHSSGLCERGGTVWQLNLWELRLNMSNLLYKNRAGKHLATILMQNRVITSLVLFISSSAQLRCNQQPKVDQNMY